MSFEPTTREEIGEFLELARKFEQHIGEIADLMDRSGMESVNMQKSAALTWAGWLAHWAQKSVRHAKKQAQEIAESGAKDKPAKKKK